MRRKPDQAPPPASPKPRPPAVATTGGKSSGGKLAAKTSAPVKKAAPAHKATSANKAAPAKKAMSKKATSTNKATPTHKAAPVKKARPAMKAAPATPFDAVRAHALGYPGAFEDHPWGETVMKVNKKVFLFLGHPEGGAGGVSLSVKLPESGPGVLSEPFTSPTGYGLGRAGWVTASFREGSPVPLDQVFEWIDESYRTVAPRKLVMELDRRPPVG